MFKCALQPVEVAVKSGAYGNATPTAAQLVRLKEIFPTGVCDHGQPGALRPHPEWGT